MTLSFISTLFYILHICYVYEKKSIYLCIHLFKGAPGSLIPVSFSLALRTGCCRLVPMMERAGFCGRFMSTPFLG